MIELTDFSESERGQIQQYVEKNSDHALLKDLNILSENPEDKTKAFLASYRILNSARNYLDEEPRKKMDKLLAECQELHRKLHGIYIKYSSGILELGNDSLMAEIVEIVTNPKNYNPMAKIIDAMLVFGEKIELNDANRIAGVDIEKDHGKQLVEGLYKQVE